MIKIIGTSHISKQSIQQIKREFKSFNPDIIAIELDRKRLPVLLSKKKHGPKISSMFKIGIKGYIFALLGEWAERKLGEHVGISPGSDMLTAFRLAKENNRKIALIDQDIEITLKKLSASITWKEKWNFFVDLVKGIFWKDFEGFDLRKVPEQELIEKLMAKVKLRYPNIHRILVSERDAYMADQLSQLSFSHPSAKILAIVGAGHEKAILRMIEHAQDFDYNIEFSNNYTVEF